MNEYESVLTTRVLVLFFARHFSTVSADQTSLLCVNENISTTGVHAKHERHASSLIVAIKTDTWNKLPARCHLVAPVAARIGTRCSCATSTPSELTALA